MYQLGAQVIKARWLTGSCVIVLSLLVSLGSCSANDSSSGSQTGAYDAEFQAAYNASTNPVAKAAFQDGVITDAELAEVKGLMGSCLEASGVEVYELNPDGSGFVRPPQVEGEDPDVVRQRADEIMQKCETETNWPLVGSLYTQTRLNPDNVDMYTLMAQCMVRMGLAPEGYTAEDYKADFESDAFNPYNENQDTPDGRKFTACNKDPLNAKP